MTDVKLRLREGKVTEIDKIPRDRIPREPRIPKDFNILWLIIIVIIIIILILIKK